MTKAGKQLIAAMDEAIAIAKGDKPAARITMAGHHYVPEPKWQPPEENKGMDWRPIDTAPKEVWVLVALDGGDYAILVYTDCGDRYAWRDGSGDNGQDYRPTHWTPLEPPGSVV